MKKILSLVIILLSVTTVFSQSFNMTNDSLVYNCLVGGGVLYDSGGPGGSYGQNEVNILTICPDVDALGIELVLASFGSNGDFLCVYDGPTASSPLLACYTTSNLPPVGSTVRATTSNPTGCLTFQFTSDGITTGGDFEFNLLCLPACKTVEAEILATDPPFVTGDTVYINSCPDDTLFFFGNGIYDPGPGYAQSNATSQFYWDFGDGTRDTTQNPIHVFPPGQIYSVSLVIEDVAGCQSRTEIDVRVRQAPPKDINFRPDPAIVCLEDTIDITAFIDFIQIGDSTFLDTITGQSAASVIDTVFLPDDSDNISGNGITTPVIYPLDIFGYIPGTTLTDINDIYEVCLEMEHSFIGDLDILVVCPNGQSATLVDFSPPGTPGNSLGIPGSAIVPGTPFEYCWSPTSTLGSIDVGQPSLANDPIDAGTYQAAGNWNDLLGCPFNGEWSIQIFDDYGGDDGWTFSGSISLNPIYLLEPDTFLIYYQNPLWDTNSNIVSILNDTVAQYYASDTFPDRLYFNVENNMGCEFRDSIDIEVSHFEVIALPEDTTICGDTIQLSASISGEVSTDCELATAPCGPTNLVTVGTQANTGESPFDAFWEDSRMQLLYTAAELNALGFTAGNISSLAFDISAKNSSAPFNNYTIKIQCTNLTTLSNTFVTTGFTTVYGPLAYNTFAGWNQHNFGLPYTWDGVSNLLVEVCFDNNDWTNEDPVRCSNTAFNSVAKTQTDGASGCSLTGPFNTTSRPNIRLTYCESQGNFVWTPNINISDTSSSTPSVWPSNSLQYFVSATNTYNCTFSDTVNINVGGDFEHEISNDTLICAGESVQLEVTGGALTVAWTPNDGSISDTAIANPIFSPLTTTTYVAEQDSNACSTFDSVTIFVSNLALDSTLVFNESCAGANDGSIEFFASNGLGTTQYSIDNGANFSTTTLYENLIAGVYDIVVTDSASCDTTYQVEILGGNPLTIDSLIGTDAVCGNFDDGTISIYISGGLNPIEYSIDGGTNFVSTSVFDSLGAGVYNISVEDSLGCSVDSVITINQPDSLILSTLQNDSLTCFQAGDGNVILSATGGVVNYEFSIDGINYLPNSTFNSLDADDYTFYVRDANLCIDSIEVTVGQPDSLFITNVVVDSTNCNGSPLGSLISFDASGGTGPYTYAISGTFVPNNVFSDSVAGNYQLEILDANNCSANVIDTSIFEPSLLEFIIDSTLDATCGEANGAIYINGLGGTPAYSYSINADPPQNNGAFENLIEGVYTLVITDANSCDTAQIINLGGSPPSEIGVVNTDSVTCFGLSDGLIEVEALNGTAPFEFSIDTGATFQTSGVFNNLSANVYSIIIRDSIGCTDTLTEEVFQPLLLSLTAQSDSTSCFNTMDGVITLTANGGTLNYQYSISDDTELQTSNIFDTLAASTYTAYVVDANGCRDSLAIDVFQPDSLFVASTIATNVTCFEDSNGTITVNIIGGTPTYTYSSDSVIFQNANVLTNLDGGTYTIYVLDGNNCPATAQDSIYEPDNLVLSIDSSTNISCNSGIDGHIEVSAIGGASPYGYSIDGINFQTSNLFNNLTAGSYLVTVQDTNSCSDTASIVLTQPDSLILSVLQNDSLTCFDSGDGNVILSATGGVVNYEFSIDGINYLPNSTFNSLDADDYTFYVRDANLCIDSIEVTVGQPDSLFITNVVVDSTNCNGSALGSLISFDASGGTGPYTYAISGTFVPNNVFSDSVAGNYQLEILDANNCSANVIDTSIFEPSLLEFLIDSTLDATCGLANGAIYINGLGGTPAYSYSINATPPQNNGTFENLLEGVYTLVITDANSCDTAQIINLGGSPPSDIGLVNTDSVTCFGLNDGLIEVEALNGTAPFEFSIDTGATFQTSGIFNNLTANVYSIIIRDSIGCTDTLIEQVFEPVIIDITAQSDSASCFNSTDGIITLTATGGTINYQYSISDDANLQTSNVFNSLGADNYTAYIVDNNGCRDSVAIEVLQPDSLFISSTVPSYVTCFGDDDGSITVNISGGTPIFSYSTDSLNFQNSNVLSNLSGGIYSVYILDGNNCPAIVSDSIYEPADLTLVIASSTNITCNSGSDGEIEVTAGGGVTPYQYSLDGVSFQASNIFNNLSEDSYTITVRDANNCIETASVTLTEPDPLVVVLDSTNINCFGDTDGNITITSIAGETAPYSVTFNGGIAQTYTPGLSFDNLAAGTYSITIEDTNGCPNPSYTNTVIIESPSVLEIDTIIGVDPLCFGGTNGSLNVTTNGGGIAPYEFNIFNSGDTTTNLNGEFLNLEAGDYAIWIVDQNGCTDQDVYSIDQPEELVLAIDTAIHPGCFGYEDGQILVSATGGTPFTSGTSLYNFTLGDGTESVSGAFIGLEEFFSYEITATDANGCTDTQLQDLIDPEPVFAEITPEDPFIEMGDTLQLNVVPVNAIGNDFVYVWSPDQGLSCTDCANPSVAIYNDQEFNLTFYDENGCFTTTSVYVEVSDTLRYFVPNAFTPGGFDDMNNAFQVYGQDLKFVDMMIFNRWGEKIYESSNALSSWDGTYKGILQNPGVYTFYVRITFLNDDEVEEKGSVTLLR